MIIRAYHRDDPKLTAARDGFDHPGSTGGGHQTPSRGRDSAYPAPDDSAATSPVADALAFPADRERGMTPESVAAVVPAAGSGHQQPGGGGHVPTSSRPPVPCVHDVYAAAGLTADERDTAAHFLVGYLAGCVADDVLATATEAAVDYVRERR